MRRGLVAMVLLIAIAVLGCQAPPAAGGPQGTSSPKPEPASPTPKASVPGPEPGTPTPGPAPAGPEPAVPEQARALVDLAKSDLGKRKGLPAEQIRVVSIEEVDWSNGSLGYPKPGMVYIQVIIPGYRIILTDGAQTYEYHTDQGQRVEHGDQ